MENLKQTLKSRLITVDDLKSHTTLELLMKLIPKVNEVIEVNHSLVTDLIPNGLSSILSEWMENGTLENLISEGLLEEIKTIRSLAFDIKVMFGVKGDGSDETTQIQKAFETCHALGVRELYFPDGIYCVRQTIDTYGVQIKGNGCFIPLLGWDYTRPNSGNLYNNYLKQCKGSILTSPDNITILKGEIKAKNIGFFGNRRCSNSSAMKVDKTLKLTHCTVMGFGGKAIDLDDGCINGELNSCQIEQNYIGLWINCNKNNGYTGETNRLYAHRCSFNRNELYAINGRVQGRFIHLNECTFEAHGEPSDTTRPHANDFTHLYHAIDLECYNTNDGMSNGCIIIENCYAEETYGFAKIKAIDPIHSVQIRNNYWRPYNQTMYSNFISLEGFMTQVTVKGNNIFTTKDIFKSSNFNVRGIESDIELGVTTGITHLPSFGHEVGSYVNIDSSIGNVIHTFDSGFITGNSFDSESYKSHPFGGQGVTYFFYDNTKLDNYDFGPHGAFENSHSSGYVLKVGGNYMGVVCGVGSNLIMVRGNKTDISIGDGSAELIQVGGQRVLTGGGGSVKIVYDSDLTPLPFGK